MPKSASNACNGTSILRLLATGPQSLDLICRHVYGKPAPIGSRARMNVRGIVGRLIAAGHVDRIGKVNATLRNQGGATFDATAKGRAFLSAGKTITSGANGPRTGVPKKSAGMRQRIWHALRLKQKATTLELCELIHEEGDPDPIKVTDNARKYFTALARAGIVKKLNTRASGQEPSSRGFLRYALLRDLGPRAPLTGKTFVTNPNAPDTEARIPYAERKAK